VESELVKLGETEGEIDFYKVRIYDRDRTICDVLRNMNKMDKEIFNKAVQGYVKDPKKNIPNLMEYAKVLKCCSFGWEGFSDKFHCIKLR